MIYRIVRDVGDSDYPPGAILDPAAAGWTPWRVARLVDQGFLIPLDDAPTPTPVSDAAPVPAPHEAAHDADGGRRRGRRAER